jgi:hypothetical protein
VKVCCLGTAKLRRPSIKNLVERGAVYSDSNWKTTPWWNDETNFIPGGTLQFTCSSSFSPVDCTGQIARWQLLHTSNGGTNLSWYKWVGTMGENPAYGLAYSPKPTSGQCRQSPG